MNTTETLLEAIETGDPVQVQAALDRHPEWKQTLNDPIPGGAFGGTALLAALHRRNRAVIDVLLRCGADINARSHWWAGSFGVLDQPTGLEDFLIERGARVDAHAAARLGKLDRLKELILADPLLVHARGGDGQTPLHFAATVEIAEFLLAHGADINVLDVDHESTPAQYMARERQDVARYLVSRGSRSDLLMAAALGDVELARKFLDEDPALIRMNVSSEWFPMRDPRAGGTIYIWVLGGNKMAHHLAREFKHDNVLRMLNERTPKELELVFACELGDEARLRELLQQQPDLPSKLTNADHQRLIAAAESSNARTV
ncbi:MAG TPA: ankyrin repeat domain-containing protein, partial [Bryobacteraceae bacterium]|nr:ankyrin repeat domain-containing protein [Bryobacteraceae bacterium]